MSFSSPKTFNHCQMSCSERLFSKRAFFVYPSIDRLRVDTHTSRLQLRSFMYRREGKQIALTIVVSQHVTDHPSSLLSIGQSIEIVVYT